jgi:hypothetical protein
MASLQLRRGARAGMFAVLALATTTAAAAEPKWIELETDSFVAYSQVSERKSNEILRELQRFQALLTTMTNLDAVPPRVPTRIFLLEKEAFARAIAGREDVAGFFHAEPFRNDIVVDVSRSMDQSLFTIYHEYVHFQARNQGHHALPAFYEEGLAQFVQYFITQGGRYRFGFFPRGVQEEARSDAMPLARVLDVEVGSEEYQGHRFRRPFYLRSLLFVHYCQIGTTGCSDPLRRFIARRVNGELTEEAFQAEFGKSTREFDALLDSYLPRAIGVHAWRPAISMPRTVAPRLKESSQEDAKVRYAALLLRVNRDHEGIDALIAPRLALSPDHGPSLVALAEWNERRDRRVDTNKLIQRLEASAQADADDLVGAGSILLKRARGNAEGMTDAGGKVALLHARRLFARALSMQPEHLEAAYSYGVTQVTQPDDLQRSLNIVGNATKRFPESGELQLLLATHFEMLGKPEDARTLMRRGACRAMDSDLREMAQRELGDVTCTRAQ